MAASAQSPNVSASAKATARGLRTTPKPTRMDWPMRDTNANGHGNGNGNGDGKPATGDGTTSRLPELEQKGTGT